MAFTSLPLLDTSLALTALGAVVAPAVFDQAEPPAWPKALTLKYRVVIGLSPERMCVLLFGVSVCFVAPAKVGAAAYCSSKPVSLTALSVQLTSSVLLDTDLATKLLGASGPACVGHGDHSEISNPATSIPKKFFMVRHSPIASIRVECPIRPGKTVAVISGNK
jgi:hypothetical protein